MRLRAFVVLSLLCLFGPISWAQHAVLRGRVIAKDSEISVASANVSLLHSGISTFSSMQGDFKLSMPASQADTLVVSCIGYENKRIPVSGNLQNLVVALETESTELDQVVVTGTGTRHRIQDVPVQTEIISARSIEDMGIQSVDELIAQHFSSVDFVQSSMGNSISINGLGSDYVLILVDGKRLTGSNGGVLDLDRIDLNEVEQIELVKGASSTLYGSDAIGGVINFIMKKRSANWTGTQSTYFGHHGILNQANSIGFGNKKLKSKTSANYKRADGYMLNNLKYNTKYNAYGGEDQTEVPLEKTYDMPVNKKNSIGVTQKLTLQMNDRFSLEGEGTWYEKRIYFPFMGRMHDYYYNDIATSLGGKYSFSKESELSFSVDYNNYKYYTEYPWKYNESFITEDGDKIQVTFYPGDRFQNSDQTNLTGRIKSVFRIGDLHKINAGVEWLEEWLESQYRLSVPKAHALTFSGYIQDEIRFSKSITALGGVRVIYHNQFGTILTPKLSVMAKSKVFTHRFSYANGFKSPTIKELYYRYESDRMGMHRLYLGNESLKPQRSRYYSYNNEFKKDKWKINTTFYLNQLNDKIDYKIVNDYPNKYRYVENGVEEAKMKYNIQEAQTAGVDVSTSVSVNKHLKLSGGYSYVDAVNKKDTIRINDVLTYREIRLNGVAEHSATWSLSYLKSWDHYKLSLLLSGKYKSDKFYLEDDPRIEYAKPCQLWNFTSNHSITLSSKLRMTVSAGILNVFDFVDNSPYGGHYASLSPGRSYFGSLKLFFANK